MEFIKKIITIEIYHVLDYLKHLMFVTDVFLEEAVEKNDILIMQDKLMILTKKLKAILEKVLT